MVAGYTGPFPEPIQAQSLGLFYTRIERKSRQVGAQECQNH